LSNACPVRSARKPRLRLGFIACLGALAGCTTSSSSSPDQVQSLGQGIYSIGVPRKTLGSSTEASNEAVDKAGAYCHAMGQKLQIVPNPSGNDVRFRCAGFLDPSLSAPSQSAPSQIVPSQSTDGEQLRE
jgi:hypothetical protein